MISPAFRAGHLARGPHFVRSLLLACLAVTQAPLVYSDSGDSAKERRIGIPVEVVPVEQRTIRAIVYGQGTARAVGREFLTFEAEGKVTYIKPGPDGRDLAAGDPVKGPADEQSNGELMASLDSRDSVAQLEIARASVEQARQQEVAARTDLDRVRAEQQVAEADLRRMRELAGRQVVSRSELEKAEAAFKQADASVKAAEAGRQTAASAVSAAEAQLVQAQLALERTSIFAPRDAIVAFLNIREGQYFSKQRLNTSSESAALQTMPIVLIDPSEFEIVLDLPTFQATQVAPGQRVYILTGQTLTSAEIHGAEQTGEIPGAIVGEVFSVSPSINPGGRSVQVKVRARPQGKPLSDGMFVNCWLVVEERQDALVLPYNTLLHEGRNSYVFVLNEATGTVERRDVKRGIRGLKGIEIIEGIKPGEKVIGKGRNRLTPGSRVDVVAERGAAQ